MTPMAKVSFKPSGKITRVLYKGVYVGRLILNEDDRFEYEEKGKFMKSP